MRKGDLVRFDKEVVSHLLEDNVDDWENWVGIIVQIENEDFCKVAWHDGIIRQEFIENLEEQGKIDALLDESTFQRYTTEPGIYDASKHDALIKQNIIKQLVKQEYPMYDPETGEAFGNIKTIIDVGAPVSQAEQQRIKLAKEKFKYERELDAADKAEFEKV